jgi:hypothetical protein
MFIKSTLHFNNGFTHHSNGSMTSFLTQFLTDHKYTMELMKIIEQLNGALVAVTDLVYHLAEFE